MLRIINYRLPVTETRPLQEMLEKKYSPMRGRIEAIHIVRKAVDARKKPDISFVYTLFVETTEENRIAEKLKHDKNISCMQPEQPEPIVYGDIPLQDRPVVIGFGPSGMLAALYLAREGYAPIVLERGSDVEQRTKDVENFWKTGELKANSNVQFGEGGAGTFSDGKLTTRISHPRLHEIAQYFVQFGAPPEILYKHKPHVGTDVLRHMVIRLREQIIAWGGEVRFGAQVTDITTDSGKITGVVVNGTETIPTQSVLTGIGHSARDTYEMLYNRNVEMEGKPFAIGVRIEHSQAMIDRSQYGVVDTKLGLGAADYSLVYHDKESSRTAYTFCMCPGGEVVASASESGGTVTNGMSYYSRNSGVANSAFVVSVGPEDFGSHPLDGIAFQREWERKAFALGGDNYGAPLQTVEDFLAERPTETIPKEAVYTYKPGVVGADLHACLPDYVTAVMARALPYFGRRLKGFDEGTVCMTGVETRTSAPVRMPRREDRTSHSLHGFYPIGEGAGFAGGIMSAALDGAESAIAFMAKYKPFEANGGK